MAKVLGENELAGPILTSLKGSNYTWRTAYGIARDTGLGKEEIVEFLDNCPDVIRSSTANTNGQFLYSTRERYRQETPLLNRVFSIIKSSTD